MRILITGGAGFIGSHLAETLIGDGHEVLVLDDLSTGSLDNIEHLQDDRRFRCVIGSVTDEPLVAKLMKQSDLVFHLAATLGVRRILDEPIETITTNVNGTEVVLRQASQDRKLVVVASTSEVYGKSVALPFREDADLVLGPSSKQRWGYAASKLLDEFLAMAYWKQLRTPTIVVRLFNTVGPRQTGRYGMVIPSFVRQALDGKPIMVHGNGHQTRSFTYVGDVVRALIGLVHEPRAVGEVFNIGNGAEISILELARKIKAMTHSRSEITCVPYSAVFDANFEDMPRRVPDIAKISQMIGYRPEVHLDEILTRVVDWTRASLEPAAARKEARRVAFQAAPAAAVCLAGAR
jgi:nucleoside-diphosphate-sugar epimerase